MIKALDNRFYIKFMQLEIGLLRASDPGLLTKALFTLYQIVKRSVIESVLDGASVHTRNAAFEAVSAPEQYYSAPLLKVERFVSDRFLKRSESSVNNFIEAELATEPRFGK